jgi:hypothetical protein
VWHLLDHSHIAVIVNLYLNPYSWYFYTCLENHIEKPRKMERSKEIEMSNVEKKMKANIVVHTQNGKMKQANLMKIKQWKLAKLKTEK